jgi:hypothetical protein
MSPDKHSAAAHGHTDPAEHRDDGAHQDASAAADQGGGAAAN